MFFSHGNPEPRARGFEEVDGFQHYYVRSNDDACRYNSRALELIDSDHAVITGYESLAIGGLEGFVTMLARKESDDE